MFDAKFMGSSVEIVNYPVAGESLEQNAAHGWQSPFSPDHLGLGARIAHSHLINRWDTSDLKYRAMLSRFAGSLIETRGYIKLEV